jgi:gamma-glutamylcyclotransferase (GGCT)/AIG2-like uncharacterized protein YtfP
MTRDDLKPHHGLQRKRARASVIRGSAGKSRARFSSHPCYLFAYGTLLIGTPDGAINQLISDFLRPRCRAYIHGRLHDLGAYPGAVRSYDLREKIFGHVFTLERPERVLPALDAYEGYSLHCPNRSEFVRRTATARQLPCQTPLTVWVYYYNWHPRRAPRLLSGDYLATSKPTGETRSRLMTPPQTDSTHEMMARGPSSASDSKHSRNATG